MADEIPGQSSASNLPNNGGPQPHEGRPAELPRQRRGTTPQGYGRYPDFDILEQTDHWDEVTRRVVLDRVERVPPIRFFDEAEAATLGAFCDTVLAQDSEPRVPVLAFVDEKMFEGKLDGYRHADMPGDRETWRLVAQKLDGEAKARGASDFAAASQDIRNKITKGFAEGELEWEGLPSEKAWEVVMRAILTSFYSHPWVWNEIGFGGPAYPRGFARLGAGQREYWEKPPEFGVDPVADTKGDE